MNINFIEKQHQQQWGESIPNSQWPTQLNAHIMKSNHLFKAPTMHPNEKKWSTSDKLTGDADAHHLSPLKALPTAKDATNTIRSPVCCGWSSVFQELNWFGKNWLAWQRRPQTTEKIFLLFQSFEKRISQTFLATCPTCLTTGNTSLCLA